MIRGPFGIPRFTDLGVFVKDGNEITEDDLTIKIERKSSTLSGRWSEYSSLSDEPLLGIGVADEGGDFVEVKMEYQTEAADHLDFDFLTYTAGRIAYGISNVGYIHKVYVSENIRRLKVGTDLIDIAIHDMQQQDIDTVYAQAVSEAGLKLLKDNGFETASDELNNFSRHSWMVKDLD